MLVLFSGQGNADAELLSNADVRSDHNHAGVDSPNAAVFRGDCQGVDACAAMICMSGQMKTV
jgi:hypothetical protein